MGDTDMSPASSLVSTTTISSVVKGGGGALVEFKKPEGPPPVKKRKVLEEDKFVEQLEKIIQRDFFPDLEKLQAQNAYHNAIENNDIHMLREIYSKYSLGATPRPSNKSNGTTPSSFETPTPTGLGMGGGGGDQDGGETPTHLPMAPRPQEDDTVSISSSKKSKDPSDNLTVNQFLSKFTSEDDQSFQEIMDNSDKKHRIKYSWLFEKEQEHKEKFEQSLALPSIESQAAYEKPLAIDTWKYKNLNSIMYVPDGAPLTAEEQVALAKKVPEVIYNNTRFSVAPFKESSAASTASTPSSTASLFKKPVTKIGIDGKEIETGTPKVNGYSLVRTPSPTPGVAESPFLTWGEIEGTPFRLDGSDTPIPVDNTCKPYRILELTKREKIAMQLQEKVSEQYRDKKLKAIETAKHNLATPKVRSSIDRLSAMSPAARKLAASHIGSSRDKLLAASYTPLRATSKVATPSSTRSFGTPSLGIRLSSNPTPTPPRRTALSPTARHPSSSRTSSSKNKAADFF